MLESLDDSFEKKSGGSGEFEELMDKKKIPQKSPEKKTDRTPIKFDKTGEGLYERGQEFLNTAEIKRQEMASNEHSFKPKINMKSEKLMKTALKEGRNPREKKIKEEVKNDPVEEKKIKPKGDVKEFIKRNYTDALNNKPKSLEKGEELDSECTFKPKIDGKSKELVQNQHVDLYQQAEELKRKRQEKIDEALKKKVASELDGCTFKPRITKPAGNYSPQAKSRKQNEVSLGYSKTKPNRLFINT